MIKAYKKYKVNHTNTDNLKYVWYNIIEVPIKTNTKLLRYTIDNKIWKSRYDSIKLKNTKDNIVKIQPKLDVMITR
jgi:hypothetical protein